MFGFSLAELFIVLIVALIFIKPQDLPEIARFIGKAIFHAKRIYFELKKTLKNLEKEFEIESLKNEVNQAIAEEKIKYQDDENDETIIVDMFGNEHRVNNLSEIRKDLNTDDLKKQIIENNMKNIKTPAKNSIDSLPAQIENQTDINRP